jgi:hypothetical protein
MRDLYNLQWIIAGTCNQLVIRHQNILSRLIQQCSRTVPCIES